MSFRDESRRKALVDTLDWLENVVIGYNLCPFAEKPLLKQELAIRVVVGTDEMEILAAILEESLRLSQPSASGTALVVCPDLAPNNFLAYLEVYNMFVEGVLPDQDLQRDLQIAPFHPLFVFGDEEDEDEMEEDNENYKRVASILGSDDSIDNYTNRSPHPTFHVLREAEVEKAVDALGGNAETVWKRNIDLLRAMEDVFVATNHPSRQQQQQQENDALLRSVFLKGTADRYIEGNNNARQQQAGKSKTDSCPFAKQSEQIRGFQHQILTLLQEFRKQN